MLNTRACIQCKGIRAIGVIRLPNYLSYTWKWIIVLPSVWVNKVHWGVRKNISNNPVTNQSMNTCKLQHYYHRIREPYKQEFTFDRKSRSKVNSKILTGKSRSKITVRVKFSLENQDSTS